MKLTEIKPAIDRSISHNESVIVEVDNEKATIGSIANDENVTELDWCNGVEKGCGKGTDVWGKRLGEDFRLFLLPPQPDRD